MSPSPQHKYKRVVKAHLHPAKAKVERKNFFDVCRLFFDIFCLFFDLSLGVNRPLDRAWYSTYRHCLVCLDLAVFSEQSFGSDQQQHKGCPPTTRRVTLATSANDKFL